MIFSCDLCGCFLIFVLIWTCFIQQDSFHPGPDLSLPPRYVKEETIAAVSYACTTWSNDLSLLTFRRLTKTKTLPPRPPPAKTGPGRPPPPSLQSAGRSQSWNASQKQKLPRKCPVLPPRPNPGHRLYNKYTVRHSQRVPLGTVITSLMFLIVPVFFFVVVAPASTSTRDRCHWPQWQQYRRAVLPGIQTAFTHHLSLCQSVASVSTLP